MCCSATFTTVRLDFWGVTREQVLGDQSLQLCYRLLRNGDYPGIECEDREDPGLKERRTFGYRTGHSSQLSQGLSNLFE